MSLNNEDIPRRNRRPPLGTSAAETRNSSDRRLLHSLFVLSQAIASFEPLRILLLRKISSSVIRKALLFSIVFEELLLRDSPEIFFPPVASLCFEELYIVLQRIRTLLEECCAGSRLWSLMQVPLISNSFRQLVGELFTLVDVFPAKELDLNEDVKELVNLIRRQCSEKYTAAIWDADDLNLRNEVVKMLENVTRGIVPNHSKLSEIFRRLNLTDSASCIDEIQNLEKEVHNQQQDQSTTSLIGLVRYAKCVLYSGGGVPSNSTPRRQLSASEVNIPADFRCPVSLDLMRDPVVVSTGHTYDRSSISSWIQSGHPTCPKTGQVLAHTQLIPNLALKNLIAIWCRDQEIPLEYPVKQQKNNAVAVTSPNRTALEATRMTVSFLVGNLAVQSQTPELTDHLVYELRVLSKTDSNSRACIAEAGALPLLAKFMGSEHPDLQINAVTTILNVSILEANKTRIMETDGVLNAVVEVLRTGATWEAKGNAAATIFSLSGVQAYRKKLGKKTRIVKALLHLARSGPANSRRDALIAILNLAGDREAAAKLIDAGVMDVISGVMDSLAEEAVTILETLVKRGGLAAISAAHECKMMDKLIKVMRDGSDRAKEGATATLVTLCRKGGSEMTAQMAAVAGIERLIWETMGSGTGRARMKAASLLRILRRWAAGLVLDIPNAPAVDDDSTATLTHVVTTTRIVLPA